MVKLLYQSALLLGQAAEVERIASPHEESIGLDEILRAARERSVDCLAAREELDRAHANLDEASRKGLPRAVLNSRYITEGGFLDSTTEVGAFGSRFASSIYVEQGILGTWRDRALAIDFATRSIPEAEARAAEIERATLYLVLGHYLDALQASERALGAEASLGALRAAEAPLERAVEGDAALLKDLLELREAIAAEGSSAAVARRDAAQARADLARLSALEIDDRTVLEPVSADAPPLAAGPMTEAALASRPDLLRLRSEIAAKEADPALVGNRLPDAAIGLGYESRGEDDPFEDSGFGVRLRIDYPLFKSEVDEARRRRARAELRQLHAREADLIRQIGLEVTMALRGLEAVRSTRDALGSALSAREEEVRVLKARRDAPAPPSILEIALAEAQREAVRARARMADIEGVRATVGLFQSAGLPAEDAAHPATAPKKLASGSKRRRAIWAWSDTFDRGPEEGARFLEFCAAHGIGSVFLSPGPDPSRPALPFAIDAFIESAARRGIEVELLVGDPSHLDGPGRAIESAVALASRLHRDGHPLHAVHLDIEPQAHPDFHAGGRERLVRSLGDKLREIRRDLGREAPGCLVSADLSPIFANELLGVADESALMIYTTDVERVVRVAAPLLDTASRCGVQMWIGVNALAGRARDESFHSLGASSLERALTEIEQRFAEHPAFRGVAIHDARAYRELLLAGDRNAPAIPPR